MAALTGRSVLVVDSEPLTRSVYRRVLVGAGAVVREAASVGHACDLLIDGVRCDVVVTDLAMPGMSGVDLVDWIRPRWPRVRVIVVAVTEMPTLVDRFDAVLRKPVPGAALVAAVVNVLREDEATVRMPRLSRPDDGRKP